MDAKFNFTEENLQKVFGHEAAEDELPSRLREYYFKTSTFHQVVADLPLRILVGHKGVGKSALFQVAMSEEKDQGCLTILIRPDDVVGLGKNTEDFLESIREWKNGLLEIIGKKVLAEVGADYSDLKSRLMKSGGAVLNFLEETFKSQDIVRLTAANKLFIDSFLKTKKVSVYIDDLDRGWLGRKEDINRISSLLNAVRDISTQSRGLQFRVSLRSDVYYLYRTSDESTDKIEGSVIWQSWMNHEIFILLVKRIESFFGRMTDDENLKRTPPRELSAYLKPVMETQFHGQGHWENAPIYRVLMSLIRKRPRDLVKLCTLAGRNAREIGSDRIMTHHFLAIFEEYSQGRLQDTINEYRSELPEVERLLLSMKPSRKERTAKEGYVYSTSELLAKINDVRQQGEFRLSNGEIADSKRLAAFMYKINFITGRKETPEGITRLYFEDNRYLSNRFVDFGFHWEIHPAYRWALQPDTSATVWKTLELSK